MARPHQLMRDYQREHRRATSVAMKRHAEARQCPKCQRKSALTLAVFDEFVLYVCRWKDCNYERAHERKANS